jgi:hypothetical protein
VGPLPCRVVDLLEHPRHREDERGAEALQLGDEVLDVRGVAELRARLDRADLDEPGEGVRQRQEQQRRGAVVEEVVQLRDRVGDVGEHVAVGEHAALGTPGRTAGIDDRGEVVGRDAVPPDVDLAGVDGFSRRGQGVQVTGVDLPHLAQLR